jgi:hypothetical protein
MADEANTGTASISGCCINITTRRWAFCPWDGTKLEDGWQYCPVCGARIGMDAQPPFISPGPWVVPMTPHPGGAYPPNITWDAGHVAPSST